MFMQISATQPAIQPQNQPIFVMYAPAAKGQQIASDIPS